MKISTAVQMPNSKGAAIFKKMLDDKKVALEHLRKGGKISEMKGKLNLVKTEIILVKR